MRLAAALVGLALVMAPLSATAQTAVIGGTVVRDSAGHPVSEAEVLLPGLNRSTRTNYLGEFRFDRIPAGRHVILIRRLGYAPLTDSVSVSDGQKFDAEFLMSEQPLVLDSQRVVAESRDRRPFMEEFERRRKAGLGGHFIDEAELRKVEGGRPLANYLASRIPGMRLYRPEPKTRPFDYYISSGRGGLTGNVYCPVTLYVNGIPLYVTSTKDKPGDPPDIMNLSADDFVAVEYYSGGASIPPQFNATGSTCGVLLLWRRFR